MDSGGLEMLMLEENLQDVATEEAQTHNQHNICECVWCKPYFSSSIYELTETINLKISDLDILKEAVKKKSLVPHPGETIDHEFGSQFFEECCGLHNGSFPVSCQ